MTTDQLQEAVLGATKFRRNAAAPLFTPVPIADLAHVEPKSPVYWWDGYIPAGVVTLLGAHGGAGKSTIGLQLAAAIPVGAALFGIPTRAGRVLFFSAEDPPELVRHRLRRVCRFAGVDPADLAQRLHILDAASGEPVLFQEFGAAGKKTGITTPTYAALREYVAEHAIDVLILDNASDTFDGSEIARAQVRAFMRALASIIRERGGAVLLLVHIDKATARGDRDGSESYSGSTAWHNSARSRLFLVRDRDGTLTLKHEKNNLGPLREPLRLTWPPDGVPTLDMPLSGFVQHIADGNDTTALLRLLAEFYGRGEFVGTDPRSRHNAVAVLGDEPTFPKRRKPADVFGLLRDAERRGLIEREPFKDRWRRPGERWQVTAKGRELAGLAASAASAACTDVAAPAQMPHAPAASAACMPLGGVGGCAPRELAAPAAREPEKEP